MCGMWYLRGRGWYRVVEVCSHRVVRRGVVLCATLEGRGLAFGVFLYAGR